MNVFLVSHSDRSYDQRENVRKRTERGILREGVLQKERERQKDRKRQRVSECNCKERSVCMRMSAAERARERDIMRARKRLC